MEEIGVDVAVLGSGVAGLWTAARLRASGRSVVVLECAGLGGVQTLASQGIIHGGTKYALLGKLTHASEAIAEMPARWRACLSGEGELDLREVGLLAENQLLWASEAMASRLVGFFASRSMRSRNDPLPRERFPPPFDTPMFRGALYRLAEPVLDTASLVAALARMLEGAVVAIAPDSHVDLVAGRTPEARVTLIDGVRLRVRAECLVLAAGAGNARLLRALGTREPEMQLRPLHMVMVRGPLPSLFAHCLGASTNPRITVTSHRDLSENSVWYLGGELAESGVDRDRDAQLETAKAELVELLPWMSLAGTEWASYSVARAEPRQSDGRRPDHCFVSGGEGYIVAWPVKLAFAPLLADEVCRRIDDLGLPPARRTVPSFPAWRSPDLAPRPWDGEVRWT